MNRALPRIALLKVGVAAVISLTAACSIETAGPKESAPIPRVENKISPRAFGDPECSVSPQTLPWQNPFSAHPSTLPFYDANGHIPTAGAIGGTDVPPSIWFEQRLWTLMGRTPSDPDATVNVHPSTAVGFTWNAVQADAVAPYAHADLDALIAAFANVDPVDSSVPQCSYGVTANVAWDPSCPSTLCSSYNWWGATTTVSGTTTQ